MRCTLWRKRHAWWAAGCGLLAVAGFMISAYTLPPTDDHAALHVRSFLLIGGVATLASRRRRRDARAAQQCNAAIAHGAQARLVAGAIEVAVDAAFAQRIELSSAVAAKLTAQRVAMARVRRT